MATSETTWLGLIVDGFLVTDEIGNGGLSRIYRARHIESGQEAVVKVVSSRHLAGARHELNQTSANQLFSGGFGTVNPSPLQLLTMEWERGRQQTKDEDVLCCIGKPIKLAYGAYGIRPFIEGQTLRRKMADTMNNKLNYLFNVARAMSSLEKSIAAYHGDLKPDNVIVQDATVKLIDPGFFGSMHCREGDIESCAITTEAYYPCLEEDDLFAFGLMVWEVLLSRHPLTEVQGTPRSDVGDSLRQWIRGYEILGRHFVKNLSRLVLASEIRAGVSASAESYLLKLLRLRRDSISAKLEIDSGFANFDQLLNDYHLLSDFPG